MSIITTPYYYFENYHTIESILVGKEPPPPSWVHTWHWQSYFIIHTLITNLKLRRKKIQNIVITLFFLIASSFHKIGTQCFSLVKILFPWVSHLNFFPPSRSEHLTKNDFPKTCDWYHQFHIWGMMWQDQICETYTRTLP